jgi:hypothetical protein
MKAIVTGAVMVLAITGERLRIRGDFMDGGVGAAFAVRSPCLNAFIEAGSVEAGV